MEASVRHLTEARTQELLARMPAFYERLQKKERKKGGNKPLPLPAAEDYPKVGGIAAYVAPSFSEDPADIAFYEDMMRLQELSTYAEKNPETARGRINDAIASLRQTSPEFVGVEPDVGMLALYDVMITSRIAELESITDEELAVVASFGSKIMIAMMGSMKASPSTRRRRAKQNPKEE